MHLQVDKSTGKDDAGLEKGGVPRQNTAPERSQSETDLFFRCPHCMFPLDGVPDPSGHLHKCSQHLDFVARGYFQTRKKCELGKHRTSRIDTSAHTLCHDNCQLIVLAINCNHSVSKNNCN